MSQQALTTEIKKVGSRLYQAGLALAHSGNISARLDDRSILITATGTFLGALADDDIVCVDLATGVSQAPQKPSSELPLHSLIYKNFPTQTVIHAHPPLVNGYFAVCPSLKALTFETKFYLGDVPVVKQQTPTVTDTRAVIDALKLNNLVVLKNHGVVAIGDTFEAGLSLMETLEEAIKVAAVARLYQKDILDDLDKALGENIRAGDTAYPMFSRDHIQAIVDLVNRDQFIAQKGKELDLTVKLAIKLDDDDRVFKFEFEKGTIVRLGQDLDAPFIISAKRPVWEQVFLGQLDSFVAVTQGKMKLQGQLGQLSRWYVPFTRLFELFTMVKFK